MELRDNRAVTPAGNPATEKPTEELNVPTCAVVMLVWPEPPCGTLSAVGERPMLKRDARAVSTSGSDAE